MDKRGGQARWISAVDMPGNLCVKERGLVPEKRENEARFLHQNEVNLRDIETKWPPTSIFPHAFAQPA